MNIEQAIATTRVWNVEEIDYVSSNCGREVSRVAQEFNGFEGLV